MRAPAAPCSELDDFRVVYVLDLLYLFDGVGGKLGVEVKDCGSRAAPACSAECHGADVDAALGHERTERSDDARLVFVQAHEHDAFGPRVDGVFV